MKNPIITFEMENGKYDENAEAIYDELLAQDYLLLRTSKAMAHNNAQNIIVSSPLMDIEMSYIELKETFVKDPLQVDTIALTQELAYVEPILLRQNAAYKVVYYKDANCILIHLKIILPYFAFGCNQIPSFEFGYFELH